MEKGQMHRCKKVDAPVTLKELNESRRNHGDTIWVENGDGTRHEHIFDFDRRYRKEGGIVMEVEEFKRLQRERAAKRAVGKHWKRRRHILRSCLF